MTKNILEDIQERKEAFPALKAAIIYYHDFHVGKPIQNINDEIEEKCKIYENQFDEYEFANVFLAALAVLVLATFLLR